MRLHQERRRKGLRCLTIELRETEIDALIGKKGVARNDEDAIRDALYSHLDRTLDAMPRRVTVCTPNCWSNLRSIAG